MDLLLFVTDKPLHWGRKTSLILEVFKATIPHELILCLSTPSMASASRHSDTDLQHEHCRLIIARVEMNCETSFVTPKKRGEHRSILDKCKELFKEQYEMKDS